MPARRPAAALCAGAWLLVVAVSRAADVHVAAFFPLTGPDAAVGWQTRKAVELAVDAVNSDASVLPGGTLVYHSYDTQGQLGEGAAQAFNAVDAFPSLAAFVGGAEALSTEGVAIVGRVFSVAQVSYGATTDLLEDDDSFPFFSRTIPTDSKAAAAAAQFVLALGWRHVAVVSSADGESTFSPAFIRAARDLGIAVEIVAQHRSPARVGAAAATTSVADMLAAVAASPARVVVMANTHEDSRFVLNAAVAAGMVGGPYQWVATEEWFNQELFLTDDFCDAACVDTLRASLLGLLGVAPGVDPAVLSAWQQQTWDPVTTTLTQQEKDATQEDTWAGEFMDPLVPFAYDSATCGPAGACPAAFGRNLTQAFRTTTFDGATGSVDLAGLRSRVMPFALENLQMPSGSPSFVEVGQFDTAAGVTVDDDTVVWGTTGGVKPSGVAEITCLPGTERKVSNTGVQFCVPCAANTYNLDGDQCLPCPAGASCAGRDNITSNVGYWRGSLVKRGYSVELYTCRPNPLVCCPGGSCAVVPEDLPASARCAANREGPVCGRCVDGTSEWNGNCIPCDGVDVGGVVGLVLATTASALIFLAKKPAKNAVSRVIVDYLQMASMLIAPLPGRSGIAGFLETDLLNLDVSGLFGGNTHDDAEDQPEGTCLMPLSPVGTVVFGYSVPLLLLLAVGLWFALSKLAPVLFPHGLPTLSNKKKQAPARKGPTGVVMAPSRRFMQANPVARAPRRATHWPRGEAKSGPTALQQLVAEEQAANTRAARKPFVVPTSLFAMAVWRWTFVCYNVVTMTGFELVLCRDVDGVQVLELAPGVECWSAEHVPALVVGVILLLLSIVGVPLTMVLMYRRILRARRIDREATVQHRRLLAQQNLLRGSHVPTTSFAVPHPGADTDATVEDPRVRLEAKTQLPSAAALIGVAPSTLPSTTALDSGVDAASPAPKTMAEVTAEDDDGLAAAGPVFTEMYQLYRFPVRGWFEAAYFTRRTLFVVLMLYLVDDLQWRSIAGFVSVVAMLFWLLLWRPFADSADNRLAVALMGSGVVISGLEIYATQNFLEDISRPEDKARGIFLDVMYVLLFGWPIVYLIRYNLKGVSEAVRAFCAARRSKKSEMWRKRHASVVLTSDRAEAGATEIEIQEWVDSSVALGTAAGQSGDGAGGGATGAQDQTMQTLSQELGYIGRLVSQDTKRAVRGQFHGSRHA